MIVTVFCFKLGLGVKGRFNDGFCEVWEDLYLVNGFLLHVIIV